MYINRRGNNLAGSKQLSIQTSRFLGVMSSTCCRNEAFDDLGADSASADTVNIAPIRDRLATGGKPC